MLQVGERERLQRVVFIAGGRGGGRQSCVLDIRVVVMFVCASVCMHAHVCTCTGGQKTVSQGLSLGPGAQTLG